MSEKKLKLTQKLKKTYLKCLKKYAQKKIAKGKKLHQKCLEMELDLFAEIHGYGKKTGLEDVK